MNNKKYYSGFSSNLKQRISAHSDGDVPQTRKCRPLELVFYAAFMSKSKALNFEKYLKSSSGFAFRTKHLI
jgi:putative endonuclease